MAQMPPGQPGQYQGQQSYPPQQPQQPVVVVQGGGGGAGKGCGTASIIIAIVVAVVLLLPGLIGLLVCGGSCASCAACSTAVSNDMAIQAERDQEAIQTAREACQPPMVFRLRDGGLASIPGDWECVPAPAPGAAPATSPPSGG